MKYEYNGATLTGRAGLTVQGSTESRLLFLKYMKEDGNRNIQEQVITGVSKVVVKSVTSVFCRWNHRGRLCALFFRTTAEDKTEKLTPNEAEFCQQKAQVSVYPCFWKMF